ncbi:UDP-glucose 4-epimerase [Synechococcus phage BUCT-ZZ01]|nr:UDP-glucose 4-epimerase [Synechococcus phage BUCT-ZZ01]
MKILVTGAAGYIASHTIVELVHQGHTVIGIDNYSNSDLRMVRKTMEILGEDRISTGNYRFAYADLREMEWQRRSDYSEWFRDIDAIIHFAALKAVGESVQQSIRYYQNNVNSLTNLMLWAANRNIKKFVFSSSAAVYGEFSSNQNHMYRETDILRPNNPYGRTKLMCEQILLDQSVMDVSILRYFNPVGAHESGLIGDQSVNNIMPLICRAALNPDYTLKVYGKDYPTYDGTCVRDYIHVVDLAKAHILALNKLCRSGGTQIYNLGNGEGTSVLELIDLFSVVTGRTPSYEFADRRAGDVPFLVADPSKFTSDTGWTPRLTPGEMCWSALNYELSKKK